MEPIRNKFPGTCNNPVCNKDVLPQQGYIQKINGKWVCWCEECVPVRKATKTPARRLVVENGEGRVYTPYEPNNLPLLRSIPGAKWEKTGPRSGHWKVSLADQDRIRLLEIADKLQLDVEPSLRKVEATEEAHNAVDAGLYDFQVEGVNWMSRREKALLGDDMGLGKTVQTLMSLPLDGGTLIVAPSSLTYNWRNEARRWRPDLTATVLKGKKNFRFPKQGEILILSYGSLPSFLQPPARGKKKWNIYQPELNKFRKENSTLYPQAAKTTLVVDEAHFVKNYKAKRSQKLKELAVMCKAVWGLTGTPLDNKPGDLYGILESLNMAFETFGSWKRFCYLFNTQHGAWGGLEWGRPRPEVPELLRRVMLRRRRAEVLPDLPGKTYTNLVVGDVDKSLQKQLDELWEEYETLIAIGEELPPFEKFSEIRASLAKSRIPAMLEYVENAEEQEVPLVVFSAHLAPLDALLGREGWAVISGDTRPEKRQEIVEAFQAGRLKGVGVSILAGGVGLSLTHAWKALFVDMEWKPSSNWQAEDRICRIGQKSNKVEIVRMVSDHPLDLHVCNLIAEKIRMIEDAIEKTITADVPEETVAPQGETQAEYEARMKRLEAAAEEFEKQPAEEQARKQRERGKAKAGDILDREQARHGRTKSAKSVLTLTNERRQAIKEAFHYMLSVCDGAVSRDNHGFNKPDAMVARFLDWAGLENDTELQGAYYMLTRYHRQLHEQWPVLWKKGSEDRKVG